MRHFVTVVDVLAFYTHRKKSWAYEQLQLIRADTGRELVTVADFAEHIGLSEAELREMMWPAKQEN